METFCIAVLNDIAWQLTYLSRLEWSDSERGWRHDDGGLVDLSGTVEKVYLDTEARKLVHEIEFVEDHDRSTRLADVLQRAIDAADEDDPAAVRDAMTAAAEHCWSLRERIIERSNRTAEVKSALYAEGRESVSAVPGYLDLIVDPVRGEVKRVGYNHGQPVRFDVDAADWHTFYVAFKGGENGATNTEWEKDYPGEWDSHRKRKSAAGDKLKALGIQFAKGSLKLESVP